MFAQVVILICALLQARDLSTELRIQPLDEAGRPLQLARADLHIDIWGGGRMIPLPHRDGRVVVHLERSWLCGSWPEACRDNFVKARLILQADGLAPVSSQNFVWLGGIESPGDAPRTSVEIELPGSAVMRVNEGESRDAVLRLRRPERRTVRITDDRAQPLAEVGVRASIFLANSNHCGATEGELLFAGKTNAAGEVTVSDADVEYAFEFTNPHYALLKPENAAYPLRMIARLTEPLTVVVLRALEKRPLLLEVTAGGRRPGVGLSLRACNAACPCGTCCGQLAESDASGRLFIQEFYPEEFDRLELVDHSEQVLWEAKPARLPESGVVKVVIAPNR